MKHASKFLTAVALIGAAMTTFAGTAAAGSCGALPSVDWWTSTHQEVRGLINEKYGGNWDPYLTQWKKYLSRMQLVQGKGGTAEVKSRGLTLKGPSLARHISDIQTRIQVLECLKSEALSASNTIEFPTAAGLPSSVGQQRAATQIVVTPEHKQPVVVGTSTKDVSDDEQMSGNDQVAGNDAVREKAAGTAQVASIDDGDFQLEVTAHCDGGASVFQVTNVGDRWPRLGAIAIHRTDNDGMLSKRRLRLNNSQQATFKIRERQSAEVGEIGIWIEPSWFQRPFRYDAKIACN